MMEIGRDDNDFVRERVVLLSISLLLLLAGPLLYTLLRQYPQTLHRTEHFLLLAVTAAVVMHILPESYRRADAWIFLTAACGWLLPEILERIWRHAVARVDAVSIAIAMLGLSMHGVLDGAVLADPGFTDQSLPILVLVHRLPDALLIWMLMYPNHSWRLPAFALLVMGFATIAGFVYGESAIALLRGQVGTDDDKLLVHFQALVAGSLLHLSTHRHDHRHAACHHHH